MKSISKKKAGQSSLTDTQTPGFQDKEIRFVQGGGTKPNPAGQNQNFNRTQSEELEYGRPIQGQYRHGKTGQPALEDADPQGSGLDLDKSNSRDKDNLNLGNYEDDEQ